MHSNSPQGPPPTTRCPKGVLRRHSNHRNACIQTPSEGAPSQGPQRGPLCTLARRTQTLQHIACRPQAAQIMTQMLHYRCRSRQTRAPTALLKAFLWGLLWVELHDASPNKLDPTVEEPVGAPCRGPYRFNRGPLCIDAFEGIVRGPLIGTETEFSCEGFSRITCFEIVGGPSIRGPY